MALDEILLARGGTPWLRWYGWDQPTISIGHFEPMPAERDGRPVVRRWTGGGVVEHGGGADYTFAIGVPRSSAEPVSRPRDSYRTIHGALADCLGALGFDSELVSDRGASSGVGGGCFTRPVAADLISPDGSKVVGGAQRRSRQGMLHQGSIQGLDLPAAIAEQFAGALAERWESVELSAGALAEARQLAGERYPLT